MKEKLACGSLVFLAIYMLLPWIITRMLGYGVINRVGKGEVALTFDDGPDPEYTPLLLDLLYQHNISATFFVLGEKAEKYPDLIKRIHREGHQLGIHNYSHSSNWLMSPRRVKNHHVDRSADIVERITGTRPTFYRPPWGIINVFDFKLKKDYQIVLWSLMARDWSSQFGRTDLKNRLVTGQSDGSVILLHDSGETFGADRDAPMYMLEALQEVLVVYKQKNLSFVRIDKITKPEPTVSLRKRALVKAWMVWERCFIKLFHVVPVDPENTFLQVRIREYTDNEPLSLEDGERFVKGDRIVELHLNNDQLLQLGRTSRNSTHLATQMIRRIKDLLPHISHLLQTDPAYKNVKGLYGITLINRGPEHLGFTVFDLPKGPFSFITKHYLRLLMYVIHPDGKKRLQTKTQLLIPKIIAISTKELESRYAA
ncbi:MAG: polysaccharide deacetylase family protein [Gorillibacterium sp.]|nr:polysaccharide deacetylase family protein [Gorillibacterium sp.]